MASTGKLNGHDLLVYVDGVALTHSTSCSVSISMSTISATTKDSNKWEDILPGTRTWSMSSENNLALDAANGIEEVFAILDDADRSVTVKFATSDAADRFFSGTAYITEISVDAPDESPATFSISFQGTGALTLSAT